MEDTNTQPAAKQLTAQDGIGQQSPDVGIEETEEDRLAAEELARITPSNEELLKLAKRLRPPASWFEGEETKPW
jgi:mRNA-degrading endonuclease toxin of MazEF toxin-antitoxin module